MATDPTTADDLAAGLETATLQLPKSTLDFLRQEAQANGVSTGDMVRIALGTQKFLSGEVKNGATVQLKRHSGTFDVNLYR